MAEYQRNKTKSIQTDKANRIVENRATNGRSPFKSKSRPPFVAQGKQKASATRNKLNQISGCLEFRGSSCRFGSGSKAAARPPHSTKCLRTHRACPWLLVYRLG